MIPIVMKMMLVIDADGYFSDEEGVDEGDASDDLGNYYGDNEGNAVDESSGFSSMESDEDSDNECDDKHDDNEEKDVSLCMKRCVFNLMLSFCLNTHTPLLDTHHTNEIHAHLHTPCTALTPCPPHSTAL